MRLRHIPGSEEAVSQSPFVLSNPSSLKGVWKKNISNGAPIDLEIGCGKGLFLTRFAKQSPDLFFLGMERYSSVLLRALQRLESEEIPPVNLKFLACDAALLTDYFAPEEIDRIFLNFSDPWPKDRHAKRRLTHYDFLTKYHTVLKKGGQLQLKTDQVPLFEFSIEELHRHPGWQIDTLSRDLHADPVLSADNLMTEYEEKFSAQGHPICLLRAHTV